MPHVGTEAQLVEQPAIGLFTSLGWQTVSALEGTFGAGGVGDQPRTRGALLSRAAWRSWPGRVAKVIERLVHGLRGAFPGLEGFSRANLMDTALCRGRAG
jgi:hypothetical protein